LKAALAVRDGERCLTAPQVQLEWRLGDEPANIAADSTRSIDAQQSR
jgi:hypothetical protein